MERNRGQRQNLALLEPPDRWAREADGCESGVGQESENMKLTLFQTSISCILTRTPENRSRTRRYIGLARFDPYFPQERFFLAGIQLGL